MLSFANIGLVQIPPLDQRSLTALSGLRPVSTVSGSAAATAYAHAQTASAAPPRAADTVAVKPLLLDLDRDHLAAFSALSEDTRTSLLDLHGQGKITTHTVESALDLALVDVRQRRFTEDRQASLTEAEKAELADIDAALHKPGIPQPGEQARLLARRQEVWLGIERSEADRARGGIPIPVGHPGVQIATGRDIMENQKLRDVGVHIGRDPGFEERLITKLRAGEIAQVGTVD